MAFIYIVQLYERGALSHLYSNVLFPPIFYSKSDQDDVKSTYETA